MHKLGFKVWDEQGKYMTRYTECELYKITVNYPKTNRTLDFVGMDRGSCILQAEVAKQDGDTVMLMESEGTEILLKKEKI